MRNNLIASTAAAMFSLLLPFVVTVANADESARQLHDTNDAGQDAADSSTDEGAQQLHDADDAGQDAADTSTDEGEHDAAGQDIDTPSRAVR
jgi:hypothetical protein